MFMKKFLENIKLPDTKANAFEVKLKYELKKDFFASRKKIAWFPIASTAMAAMFLVLFSIMVISPNTANKVHVALFKGEQQKSINNNFDLPLASGRSITPHRAKGNSYANVNNSIRVVNDLSQLDPNKSYVVKKVTSNGRASRYYVSEVRSGRYKTKGPIY